MQFTKRYYLEALFQRKPLHPFEVDWSPVIDAHSWKCPPNMYEKKKPHFCLSLQTSKLVL